MKEEAKGVTLVKQTPEYKEKRKLEKAAHKKGGGKDKNTKKDKRKKHSKHTKGKDKKGKDGKAKKKKSKGPKDGKTKTITGEAKTKTKHEKKHKKSKTASTPEEAKSVATAVKCFRSSASNKNVATSQTNPTPANEYPVLVENSSPNKVNEAINAEPISKESFLGTVKTPESVPTTPTKDGKKTERLPLDSERDGPKLPKTDEAKPEDTEELKANQATRPPEAFLKEQDRKRQAKPYSISLARRKQQADRNVKNTEEGKNKEKLADIKKNKKDATSTEKTETKENKKQQDGFQAVKAAPASPKTPKTPKTPPVDSSGPPTHPSHTQAMELQAKMLEGPDVDEILHLGSIMEKQGISDERKAAFDWLSANKVSANSQPALFAANLNNAVGDVQIERTMVLDCVNDLMFVLVIEPDEYMKLAQMLERSTEPMTVGQLAHLLQTETKFFKDRADTRVK